MITRHHSADGVQSWAQYSDCETYRYALSRVWDEAGPQILFVMLNPSKATEAQNDPTIERCQRRAQRLGFGGFCAANLFALRETDPRLMRQHPAPIGPGNAQVIHDYAARCDMILCAWGTHGAHMGQGPHVEQMLRSAGYPLHSLGLTKDGHPRHPLYIRYEQPPQTWRVAP